jgi:hypothetical protein
MKILKLKLEYNLPKGNSELPEVLTCDYLISSINMKYKDGLEGQLRRVFGRIQRKCDEAIDKKYDVLELEDSEFDLIQDCFEDAKFPPILSKYINILEDEIERSAKENK